MRRFIEIETAQKPVLFAISKARTITEGGEPAKVHQLPIDAEQAGVLVGQLFLAAGATHNHHQNAVFRTIFAESLRDTLGPDWVEVFAKMARYVEKTV